MMQLNRFLTPAGIGIFFFLSCNPEKKIISATERWYDLLPDCPCRNPDFDTINNHDGWARELHNREMRGITKLIMGKKDFTFYHKGAAECFRSYPTVKTSINGRKFRSGQQCAYDERGDLIKTGLGAGTPDKVSPARGENKKGALKVGVFRVIGHNLHDSGPWDENEWMKYHKYWPPNIGKDCGGGRGTIRKP